MFKEIQPQALEYFCSACALPLSLFLPLPNSLPHVSIQRWKWERERSKDTLITQSDVLNFSLSVHLCHFHPHNEHKPLEMLSPNALALLINYTANILIFSLYLYKCHPVARHGMFGLFDGFWQHDIEKVCTYRWGFIHFNIIVVAK